MENEIETAIARVRKEIETARRRSPYGQAVTLLAVTKFHSSEEVERAVRCGVVDVGENRVQELEDKRSRLSLPITWHLQGHLQKNKVKKAVAAADLIQSVDSAEILRDIDRRAENIGKVQRILLEFNISGEESKYGFSPSDFSEVIETVKNAGHVELRGLMCMAPMYADPQDTRPVFREGRRLWEKLRQEFPDGQISVLSMGMSRDFPIAVEEGATMVRIGTAIFGARR